MLIVVNQCQCHLIPIRIPIRMCMMMMRIGMLMPRMMMVVMMMIVVEMILRMMMVVEMILKLQVMNFQ